MGGLRIRRGGRRARLAAAVLGVSLVSLVSGCGAREYESMEALAADFFGPSFNVRSGGDFGLDRMRVEDADGMPFDRTLVVSYPERSASQLSAREDGTAEGGAQVYLRLKTGPVDAARLRYYVQFPEGFDFVKGGKLPGLYGGTATAGRRTPDGDDGFSTRYMWRADGEAEVYAYLPESEERGTSLGRGAWSWPTGRWVLVQQEVVLDDPDADNGRIRVAVDGEEVFAVDDVDFRDTEDVQIEGVFFSTFFGGGDASWATPVDQEVRFADIVAEPLPAEGL